MLKKNTNGEWSIAGIGRVIPVDREARRVKLGTKAATDPVVHRVFGSAFGLSTVEPRVEAILGRDSVLQRERLQARYDELGSALLAGTLPSGIARAVQEARELKPEVAAPRLRESLPPLLLRVKDALSKTVSTHVEKRLKPAQEAVKAAIRPDPLSDPAQAAMAAIRAMEIRNRISAMSHAERLKAVALWGKAGNVEALDAISNDPFGFPVAAEVMQAAESAALTALGGAWLADDLADAVEETAHLAAMADVAFDSIKNELRQAGVPAPLLQDTLAMTQWVNGQAQ